MAYFAELDASGKVIRVLVVEDLATCEKLFGKRADGTDRVWKETKIGDPDERYAGIGDTYKDGTREKFDPSTRDRTP